MVYDLFGVSDTINRVTVDHTIVYVNKVDEIFTVLSRRFGLYEYPINLHKKNIVD